MADIAMGFRDVDRQTDRAQFESYLREVGDRLADQKEESLRALQPFPSAKLLDVGCGLGGDVRRLADLIGPSGRAVGVDRSRAMVDSARRENTTVRNADFMVGDAHGLPFPDNQFDGARADRTLQHVDDPRAVLKEMLRVVRPGGRIVVSEPDWGSLVIDTSDPTTELEIVRRLRDEKTRNGRIGRELVGHLVQLGLSEIFVRPFTLALRRFELAATILRLQDVASPNVLDEMARRDEAGTFFAAVTGFTDGGVS